MKRRILLSLFLTALIGCAKEDSTELRSDHIFDTTDRVGQVVETIEVAGYTYIQINEHGRTVWLASQPIWVQKGDFVAFAGGGLMKDFHSKELDRTFDYILFVDKIALFDAAEAEKRLGQNLKDIGLQAGQKEMPVDAGEEVNILMEPVENGVTVKTIFDEHGKNSGKTIRLRARVTKVNTKILGRNWVTLSDGTGVAPENFVTATTQELPNIGDTYVVEGTIGYDKYIGPGYTYKVLVEDANFTQ